MGKDNEPTYDSISEMFGRVRESLRNRTQTPYNNGESDLYYELLEAKGKILRLEKENKILREDVVELTNRYKESEVSQSETDRLDPRGYCKALGANPDILKSLNQEEAEKYLKSLRNAQAYATHPDRPGTAQNVETMKIVNE